MENKEKWNSIRKIGKRQDENQRETENVRSLVTVF
jgi:hypothetical protein